MASNDKTKNTPVTGTVSAELREFIEEYRWSNRKTVSEVVREAFETWGATVGYAPTAETGEAAQGDSETVKTGRKR